MDIPFLMPRIWSVFNMRLLGVEVKKSFLKNKNVFPVMNFYEQKYGLLLFAAIKLR